MTFKRALIVVAIVLFFLDSLVAYGFSPLWEKELLRIVNEKAHARIQFRDIRVHPLLLSISAKDVEIFDPDRPRFRVLYGQKVIARLYLFAFLFHRRMELQCLRFEKFRLNVIQDAQGVLNIEKILSPALPQNDPNAKPPFVHGWKHSDWFFNAYLRLRFAASPQSNISPQEKKRFGIHDIQLADGTLVLSQHTAKPIIFQNIYLRIQGLRWFESGAMRLDSIWTQGQLRTKPLGFFKVFIRRHRREVRVDLALKNLFFGNRKHLNPKIIRAFRHPAKNGRQQKKNSRQWMLLIFFIKFEDDLLNTNPGKRRRKN